MSYTDSVALLIKRQSFPGTTLYRLNRLDYSCQRKNCSANDNESTPSITNWPCGSCASVRCRHYGDGSSEPFEVEHLPGHLLDGAMVLLDDVVEVFNLVYRIGMFRPALIAEIAALLAPLLSIVTLFGLPFAPMALSKKRFAAAMSRFAGSRTVDGFALLVDSAVEVFPEALDLDVCLIHAPVAVDRALLLPRNLLDEWQKRMAHR